MHIVLQAYGQTTCTATGDKLREIQMQKSEHHLCWLAYQYAYRRSCRSSRDSECNYDRQRDQHPQLNLTNNQD